MTDQAPIAQVVAVTGEVYVRNADGELRLLAPGSVIYQGERIVAEPGESVELVMSNGQSMVVDSTTPLTFSEDLQQETAETAEDAAVGAGSIDELLKALESGQNIDDLIEAPAAGSGGNEGHSFVILDRIAESIGQQDQSNSAPGVGLPDVELPESENEPVVAAVESKEPENAAPTITVTANDFTEDDGALAGDAAGTYVTSDEEGDAVTVSFTTPSTHYVLNNGRVELTQAGVDAINAGTALDAIELTVTQDNDTTLFGTGSDTPVVNAQNDGPAIDVILTTALNENSAAAGNTVATFVATDEEDGTPSVGFTGSSNSAGYYVISGTNVNLTAAGAAFVQGGGTLPAVDLTATDSGSLTAQDDETPVVNAENDAPSTLEDTYSVTEGAVLNVNAGTGLLNNDSDEEGDEFTVSRIATDVNGTGAITVGGELTTALGGTVTVNADGSFSYTAPSSLDHSSSGILPDSFAYRASGGDESGWTRVTINVADTAPDAVDDFDSVGLGMPAVGNVISGAGGDGTGTDDLGADATLLVEVSFGDGAEEVTLDVDDLVDGRWTIDGANGTLVINQNGNYTYTSSQTPPTPMTVGGNSVAAWQVDVNLYGFQAGTSFESDSGMLNVAAANATIGYSNNNGLFINSSGASDDSNELDQRNGNTEAIVIDLQQMAGSAEVTLRDVDNNEGGRWTAYDAVGNLVDTGTFLYSGGGSNNIVTVTITPSSNFQYLVFTGENNGDDYNIQSLIYQPVVQTNLPDDVFGYTLSDSDGDSDNATLTIQHDLTTLAVFDTAMVDESALATGTNAGSGQDMATGNLIDNDESVGANAGITQVSFGGNTGTPVSGVITINGAHGILTVYTVDEGDHRAGDYEYILTSASSGDNVAETFQYTLRDSVTNQVTSSTLSVAINDDAPVGSQITQSVGDSDLATYNLVLVLDISGSMDATVAGAGGQTRLQIAVNALSELIRRADDNGTVNVQIVPFSNSASSSAWFNDDIYSAISFLEALQAYGFTHYDTALQQVISANAATTPPPADKTLLYFVSDGIPNDDHGVDDGSLTYRDENGNILTGVAAWEAFSGEKVDISFGIGIGDAQLTDLRQVAFPNTDADGNGQEDYAFTVSNPMDLAETLLQTVNNNIVTGSLGLLTTGGSSGFMIGADGGYISSIVIDGTTYSYDPNAVPADSQSVTVNTVLGGIFILDFVTGAYSYEASISQGIIGQQENFQISVMDNDGDSLSINVVLNLDYNATVDANRDIVITNDSDGSPIEIPAIALLWNDSGQNRSLTSSSGASDGTVTGTDPVSFDPSAPLQLPSRSDFETVAPAAIVNENTADSETNPINNTLATAVDLTDRSLFSSNDSNIGANPPGTASFSMEFDGTINSDDNAGNGWDADWLKIRLVEGERVWADINYAGRDTDVFVYDNQGNFIQQFAEDAYGSSFGGYTAPYTGDFYIQVQAAEATANVSYELILSIVTSNANYDQALLGSFDYTMSSGGEQDDTTVEIHGVSGSTVTGGNEEEVLVGGSGNDTLVGNGGDDALVGKAGNDILLGGDGRDLLMGGQGDDTLTGGAGADVFAWSLGDAANTTLDVVTDFNTVPVSGGGDALDLSDLLVDEQNNDLTNYLYVELSDGDTLVHINTNGGFAGGFNSGAVEQTIELSNVDLVTGFADQNALLQDLVNNGKLITD